ncbi:unnamed protein product [Rangifer tarandus platyrhynchus]|uniref:Uncharacterized protein n=1 Tax=Rangifer tarandus platyrhynchus TaxID=3082113 RepID=A0AC59ZS88_RANTA
MSGDRVVPTALVHLAHGCPQVSIHASRGQTLLQVQPAVPSLGLGSGPRGHQSQPRSSVRPKASPLATPASPSPNVLEGDLFPKSSPGLDTEGTWSIVTRRGPRGPGGFSSRPLEVAQIMSPC